MRSLRPDLAEFGEWMGNLGWIVRDHTAKAIVWEHVPTGNVYSLSTRARTDSDLWAREVVMLSPECQLS